MTRRSEFLVALGLTGAVSGLPTAAGALDTTMRASPAPTDTPSGSSTSPPKPSPTAGEKPVSAAALAIAQSMRRFDPKLSDDEITTIARGIEANATSEERALNSKSHRLKNSDEPVTIFAVHRP